MMDLSLFSIRLKELMKEKGVNQAALSKETGISNQAISNWLNKKGEPMISFAWRLANYFDCSVDYLIGRKDDY